MNAAKRLLPLLLWAGLGFGCGDPSKGAAAITTPSPRTPGIEQNLTAISGPSLSKRPTQPALPPRQELDDAPVDTIGSPGTSRTPRSVDHDLLERQVAVRLMP